MGSWQYEEWDISTIASTDKDNIDWFGFRINNDYGSPKFYIDQIRLYGSAERSADIFVDADGSLNILTQKEIQLTRTTEGSALPGLEIGTANVVLNQPLEVNVPGDVGIDYDLYFANTGLSTIYSEGPLKISAGDPNSYENLTITTGGTGDIIIDIADSTIGFKIFGSNNTLYTFTPRGVISQSNDLIEMASTEHGLYQNFAQTIVSLAVYATNTAASSTYHDVTSEANSCAGSPHILLSNTDSPAFFWGFSSKDIDHIYIDLANAASSDLIDYIRYSTSSQSTWQNFDSWPTTTITDTTNGLQQDGKISWTPPANWGASDLGDPAGLGDIGSYYWIAIKPKTAPGAEITAYYDTPSVMCSDFIRSAQGGAVKFRVDYAGTVYAVNTTIQSADVAEIYPSAEVLEPGDVVCFDELRPGYVKVCDQANSQNLAGVVSTKAGLTLGGNLEGDVIGYPVALVGRVPVKVSLENGPIKIGDPLTSASIPGVAMRANKAGKILGYALEPYNPLPTSTSSQIDAPEKPETLGEKWEEIETIEELITEVPPTTTLPTFTQTTSTQASSTQTTSTQTTSSSQPVIGKILAFVNLTYLNPGLTIFQKDNGEITISAITEEKLTPLFSIDEKGYLVAEKIKAKEIVTENLKVGVSFEATSSSTSTLANGITIYDRVTGKPYCLYIENGQIKTTAGECGNEAVENSGSNSTSSSTEKETDAPLSNTSNSEGETTSTSTSEVTEVSTSTVPTGTETAFEIISASTTASTTDSSTTSTNGQTFASSRLEYCTSTETCNNAESQVVCDAEHLDLCDNETDCINAGGYWYDDKCNAQPKDTDGDGVIDSEDLCPETAGDFCHGCSKPECSGCQSPICPEKGKPICQDDNSLCQVLPNTNVVCQSGVCSYSCQDGYLDCNGDGTGSDADGCEFKKETPTSTCPE